MSRQHQTRTSTRKAAIGQKPSQFTQPSVIQPKTAKKSKEQLPEWKPGGSGIASPLARLQQTAAVQAKLTVGQPNDKYEQEADRVARDVVGQINSPVSEVPQQNQELQKKPQLQLREAVGGGEASTALESEINQAKSSGQSLDSGLQRSMGSAMGADFSSVKVHTDDRADRLNRSMQARAFTTGPNVFFKRGEYNPGTKGGQELIAHELTHVVQQGSANPVQRDMIQRDDDPPGTTTDTTTTTAPITLTGLFGGGGGAPGAPVLSDLKDNYPTKANLLDKFKWDNWKDVVIWAKYRAFIPEIVLFLDAVEKYQSSPSYAEMVRIYHTYVESGSELEVNIAWTERESIRRRVEAQVNGGQQPINKIFNAASCTTYALIAGGTVTAWKDFKEGLTLKVMANLVRAGMLAEDDLSSHEWDLVDKIEKDYKNNKRDLNEFVAGAMQEASRWDKLTGKAKKAAIAAYYAG